MKRLIMLLGLVAVLASCTMCKSDCPSEARVEKKEVKHVVTVSFYIHQGPIFAIGDEMYYPVPDVVRGPWREATGRIEEAVDERIKFKEVRDPLCADIIICLTDTDPSVLAYWAKDRSILALNRMAGGGNVMQTLLHEALHALNIDHSGDCNSIMYYNANGSLGTPMITKELRDKLLAILDGKK
jgi:hypothetical protein